MVGDVRGWGLFVGLEIVKNRENREPATEEAQWIVDRMKSLHKVLISSDGPYESVLKLKPPMVFSIENADEFITAITECLTTLQEVKQISFLYSCSTYEYSFRIFLYVFHSCWKQ